MIQRKLYRSGNSIVIALPSYMLERLELDAGDSVTVYQGRHANTIILMNPASAAHNRIGRTPASKRSR
jgi:antitoxin component of MazEF toxin-antitoxin module